VSVKPSAEVDVVATDAGAPPSWPEICDRYEALWTAAVNDVLRAHGLLQQTLPPAIVPLQDGMAVAGLAFTISGAKSTVVENEMPERAAMLDAIRPGSVCVWETGGDDTSAQWGEVMTMASQRRGCRGAVIDGGVRDTTKVLALDFPVFCRYRTSNGMLGRFRLKAWDIPVRIGAVDIHPGDVIFGDADGVIVVPRALAVDVLAEAEQVKLQEVGIRQMITDGVSPQDVVRRGGYF